MEHLGFKAGKDREGEKSFSAMLCRKEKAASRDRASSLHYGQVVKHLEER